MMAWVIGGLIFVYILYKGYKKDFVAVKITNQEELVDYYFSDDDNNNLEIDLSRYTHYEEVEVVGVHVKERIEYAISYVKHRLPVVLEHEPDNPYSSNAIKVMDKFFCFGYIEENKTEEVLKIMKSDFLAVISQKTLIDNFLTIYLKVYYRE